MLISGYAFMLRKFSRTYDIEESFQSANYFIRLDTFVGCSIGWIN